MLITNKSSFQIKHGISTATVKIRPHLQQEITVDSMLCLLTKSIVIVIQMNHT